MSKQTYPPHHPHYGREFIVVHDHDVLCGRGINISQHVGNERFRALVNTRYDESYCASFSTSEKKALAQEIIDHIRSLDPPGRFLKRYGRSSGTRGLSGPWEELSPREVLKKTCQALRDCNRNDRTGYAASVKVPEDVKKKTDELNSSGMSLKEHAAAAAAAAARSSTSPIPSSSFAGNTPVYSSVAALKGESEQANGEKSEKNQTEESKRISPLGENPAGWLRRGSANVPMSRQVANSVRCSPHEATSRAFRDVETASFPMSFSGGAIHATPTVRPLVAPVPVTNTPHHPHPYPFMYGGHVTASAMAASRTMFYPPEMPPSPSYEQIGNEDDQETSVAVPAISAPYSPDVWEREHGTENDDIDDPSEPVPMSDWRDHSFDGHGNDEADDVLQSAADAAAALTGEDNLLF